MNIDDEGYPIQPYGFQDNPYSILDVADIVFVNPVNTGYSRILHPEADRKQFFGVNQDIDYLAEWINTFVSRVDRWASPKYLIGESYGTTRVSGLANELQNSHWMYINGVILVSPTGLGIDRSGPVNQANRLPYYTAAAWYHEQLPEDLQSLDLLDALEASEEFTQNELIPILAKGAWMSENEKNMPSHNLLVFQAFLKRLFANITWMFLPPFSGKTCFDTKDIPLAVGLPIQRT